MYSRISSMVLAFHGCDVNTKNDVLYKNIPLSESQNDYDWLGHGVYFWEHDEMRALEWAEEQGERKRAKGIAWTPAVIGAVVDLGNCLNLMGRNSVELLKHGYRYYEYLCKAHSITMAENKGTDNLLRYLDCAVIETTHGLIEGETNMVQPFDTVRGAFIEGEPIYPGSMLHSKTHIQICVRNPNNIKGYFDPRTKEEWPK